MKGVGLVAVPLAVVTVTGPLVALIGTMTRSSMALAAPTMARSPLKRTSFPAVFGSKPAPLMVTGVPTGPLAGVRPVMENGASTASVRLPGRRPAALAVSVAAASAVAVTVKLAWLWLAPMKTVCGTETPPVAARLTMSPCGPAGSAAVTVTGIDWPT